MNFSFLSPTKIIIGKNESLNLYKHIQKNSSIVLYHGASLAKESVFKKIIESMSESSKVLSYEITSGEPSPGSVDSAAKFAIKNDANVIIGIGCGSVMDTAKAVSALVTNGLPVLDYLEGVGNGKQVSNKPLPFIAVPTTSGTGTEVTKNAVISSLKHGFKKSIRDDDMIAKVAVLDYSLTMGLPKNVTASSGMDAICQLIESYVTKNTNSITDALALHHSKLAVDAIEKAYHKDDEDARQVMSVCAMVSGLCLANAGLGMVHGIAAGLGATLGIPHGIACGLLLPHVMKFNYDHGIYKYADLAEVFYNKKFESKDKACEMAIYKISELNTSLNIPKDLKGFNIKKDELETLSKASMGSSMSKNPVLVSIGECHAFLENLI